MLTVPGLVATTLLCSFFPPLLPSSPSFPFVSSHPSSASLSALGELALCTPASVFRVSAGRSRYREAAAQWEWEKVLGREGGSVSAYRRQVAYRHLLLQCKGSAWSVAARVLTSVPRKKTRLTMNYVRCIPPCVQAVYT